MVQTRKEIREKELLERYDIVIDRDDPKAKKYRKKQAEKLRKVEYCK